MWLPLWTYPVTRVALRSELTSHSTADLNKWVRSNSSRTAENPAPAVGDGEGASGKLVGRDLALAASPGQVLDPALQGRADRASPRPGSPPRASARLLDVAVALGLAACSLAPAAVVEIVKLLRLR